jgi:Ni,Fe-hydrogenase I large subunit
MLKSEEPKKEKFFSKFFSAIKSEIKEEIGINKNVDMSINNNYISFTPEEFANIFNADKRVLETFKTDKSLNVKFEYNGAEKIKETINDFFICQLPQPTYKKFISKICETFSDLLYSSFVALKDIKNLQIVAFALYCRYMRFKLKVEELQSVIKDLNQFAESWNQIKETLTKTKNEFEFKYTNSMMTISQLNSSILQKDQEIYNMNLKIKEKDEKYDKFKNEIIKEYNKIKDDFNLTKKERDAFKGTLIELKNFFVKIVTGELLN